MQARKPYPSELQDRFIIRLPDGMRDRLGAAARANKRSTNAEIVARLEASFEGDDQARSSLAAARLLSMSPHTDKLLEARLKSIEQHLSSIDSKLTKGKRG